MFYNRYSFNRYVITLVHYFSIKQLFTTVKNPEQNTPLDQVNQVMHYIRVTNYLDNKLFDYMYPWGENLYSISCSIRTYYHRIFQAILFQYIFGTENILNFASVV